MEEEVKGNGGEGVKDTKRDMTGDKRNPLNGRVGN